MLANSGKSTTSIKLQDLDYRVTAINGYYLNAYCGLLPSEKFCKIFVFHDDAECYYNCGINERYSNIKIRWQDLTSGKMLEYVNVYAFNGEIVGNVMRLKK